MKLVIQQGNLLADGGASVQRRDILIEDGRIAQVAATIPPPPEARVLDGREFLVLPGLVNAHTHSHNSLMRGLADNWTLEDLLNFAPALYSGRTAEDHYVSAAICAVEMLKSGATAAYDLFMAFPAPTEEAIAAVVQAYADVGLRAVVAPAMADMVFYETVPDLYEHLPPDLRATVKSLQPAPADRLLGLAEAAIKRWHGAAGGRIRVGVAPTIPGQCTDEFLEACGRLAREYDVGLHTHLAETKVQAIYAQRRWGKTIVARCEEAGLLTPSFVGAHAIWLTDEDMDVMARTGSMAVHNPASNLKLGSGIAPIREYLERGIPVALGCDGSLSSDSQNMFTAMHLAAMVGKVRCPHHQERWVGAQDVWSMATVGGARATRWEGSIGAVAPGYEADLVLVRMDSSFLTPLNHPVNALVYAESGANVDTVIIAGRVVMEGGKVLTVDERQLQRRAQEAAERLRRENRERWMVAERIVPYLAAACRQAVAVPYPVNRYAAAVT